ncbi:phage tail protein [Clostridium botulinum]|uniref:phage tail protein n=1 Tax=Clostridium botulinum TaxID=1491 RepID=UPI001E415A42|nr:phage tail protein [Clostridium botulinum]MCD3252465.1 hypothetical protein [Clostridium botulinum C/D]MCD3277871.1 hypothetical protein [Clostridium botulinum C/D]MCD3281246.1 hypothetical protein [Clostridium botulinum C/D]MCD3355797.1 hypothetical protein [Clostridium botulinum C/D]
MSKIYFDGKLITKEESDKLLNLGYIDLDKDNAREGLEIILCKPNGEELAILDEAYNVIINQYINAVDELEFDLPFYINSQYEQIKNYNWDETHDHLFLKVNNKIMFVINSVSDIASEFNTKHIHAYSREFLLTKRYLPKLQGTRQLYKDGHETTVCSIKYSLDGNTWNNYSNTFEIQKGKNVFIKLYDNFGNLLNEYVWNSGDEYKQFEGLHITHEVSDVFNKKINVEMKIVSETGEGLLNLLEQETSWTIGYIDPEVREDRSKGQNHRKYKTFDIKNGVWLEIIYKKITDLFQCIVDVDTINQKFNIYSINNFCRNKGLYISKENYLKQIKKETINDEVITRLRVYGNKNLSIASVNPLGTEYIEDYSYYRNPKYMSYDLLDALDKYDQVLKNEYPKFYNYLQELKTFEEKVIEIGNQIVDLNMKKTQKEDIKDVEIQHKTHHVKYSESTGDGVHTEDGIDIDFSDIHAFDLTEYNKKIEEVDKQIKDKEKELKSVEADIDNRKKDIETLRKKLAKENNFTKTQLNVLDNFVKEGVWENKNYDNANELYEAGLKASKKLSKPSIKFEIEMVDFLNIVECQKDWDKVNIGDIVNIYYDDFDLYVEAKIVKISHGIDKGDLQLTISNKKELDDDIKYISDIAKMANDANNTIDMFKHKWDLSGKNTDLISKIMNDALDSSKNRVLSARNQNIKIDERGIQMKDMFDDNEQLRLVNNTLAFTQDGWNSCSVAINPQGICAPALYGKVIGSNKLIITNMNDKGESSFLVDGNHMKAINMDLSLLRKNLLNRIYMNPEIGFKIQKRDDKVSDWRDLLWLDMDGEIYAKSFHVINTNTELNDKGLAVDNGKIKIVNENGQDAIYCDENGDMRLDGRLRVTRHLEQWKAKNKWDLEPEENRVILLDAYKDKEKGGKLLVNDWNGNTNVFLGSPPSNKYSGGFMKIFSGINADKVSKGFITENDNSRERLELGILKNEDTGIINIKNKDTKNIVSLLGNDKSGEVIINNNKENPLISLKGNTEGGIIQVNGQEKGSINAFLGALENDILYEGGHLKLYNKKLNKQRAFLGIRKSDDAGSLELYAGNNKRNVLISARDNENKWQSSGVVKLYNQKGDTAITLTADTNKNPMKREGISQMVFGEDVENPRLALYSGNGEYGSYIQMGDKRGRPQMFIGNVSKEETPGGCQVWYANMGEFNETHDKKRVQIYVNNDSNAQIDFWDTTQTDALKALACIKTGEGQLEIHHMSGRQITFTKDGKILFD